MQDKTFNSNVLDQRDLVLTGMSAVRKSKAEPSVSNNSFVSTNTCSSKMIPFSEWIKKIEQHITGSDSFDVVHQYGNIDKYSFLPPFWQAMDPEKKQLAVNIVKSHDGNAWGIECVKELMSALKVLPAKLPAYPCCRR